MQYRDYIIELNNKETIREHKYNLPRFGIAATKTILEHKQRVQHTIKLENEVKRRMSTLQFMDRVPDIKIPSEPPTTNIHF